MEATVANPADETAAARRVGFARVGAMMTTVAVVGIVAAAVVAGPRSGTWTTAYDVDAIGGNSQELNSPFLDACAIESPDGLSLYMASSRPRFAGDTRTDVDIWVARRERRDAPWRPPENLPEPVNSPADDFCPSPAGGDDFYFVSTRTVHGVTCGSGDLYLARHDSMHGWSDPEHLACAPDGPNSELDEQGPSYVRRRLYFSRSSDAIPGDLYVSEQRRNGKLGPAAPMAAVNDASAADLQPAVRDDGLELLFSSNRSGGGGGHDLWVATRASTEHAWSAPVNAGSAVNTRVGETRPSLSADGETLYLSRAPGLQGSGDIYAALRHTRAAPAR